jgi:hypothetical protein
LNLSCSILLVVRETEMILEGAKVEEFVEVVGQVQWFKFISSVNQVQWETNTVVSADEP